MVLLQPLREWMCSRLGHNRILIGSGRVQCTRCGHIRPVHPDPRPPLLDEYMDEVDPDPTL